MSDNWDSDVDNDGHEQATGAAATGGSRNQEKSGWAQPGDWDGPSRGGGRGGGRGSGSGSGWGRGGDEWRGGGRGRSRGGGGGGGSYGSGRFRHANYEENIWGGGAGAGVDSWGAPYRGRGGGRGRRDYDNQDEGWGGYRGYRGSRGGGGGRYRDDDDDGFGGRGRRGRGGGFGGRGGRGDYENGFERRRERYNDNDGADDDGWDRDARPRENYVPKEDSNEEHLFADGISSGINFDEYDNVKSRVSGDGSDQVVPIDSFEACGLRRLLLDNIKRSNYSKPTPVQRYVLGSGISRGFFIANILHVC